MNYFLAIEYKSKPDRVKMVFTTTSRV